MLRGVTDPIKRAEAVNSIVRSISVIPDQIVRATYLTDCAQRLGWNEATLISTMNQMIRGNMEQRRRDEERERERAARGDQGQPSPTAAVPANPGAPPLQPAAPMVQASQVERMLMQELMPEKEDITKNVVSWIKGVLRK